LFNRNLISFATLCCSALVASRSLATPLPLYVLAGQSNMSGWGRVDELPEAMMLPQADVYYYTRGAGFGYLRTTDDDFGPELGFGWTMSAALRQPLAIVKYTKGSSTLAEDWNPDLDDNTYSLLLAHVAKARRYWEAAGYEVQVAGIVWQQGEDDSKRAAMASAYGANLLHFIEQVRLDLDAPDAPFIYGQLRGETHRYRDGVRAAQQAVDAAGVGAYLVETDDLSTWDGVHFDTPSQLTLGRRFATAMLGARSKLAGDVNGDGLVGLADLNAVRNNFGAYGEGDANQDGLIDIEDLNLVRNYFGDSQLAAAAPEPSSWFMAFLGATCLASSRRLKPRLPFACRT